MSGSAPEGDPGLLLEAARVFDAAGGSYRKIAEALSEKAVAAPSIDTAMRAAILCDAAALRLSGRVPGGYGEAENLLRQADAKQSEDDGARVFILLAFAKGQEYAARSKDGAAPDLLAAIAGQVRDSLRKAFARRPDLLDRNRHFWDGRPRSQLGLTEASRDREDDLRAVFEKDADFQAFIASETARQADEAGQGRGEDKG